MHRSSSSKKWTAASIAALGWSALVLQFCLIALATHRSGDGWWTGASRFFGFFTILTNLFVALVLSAASFTFPGSKRLSSPRVLAAAASYIAVVGIVYSLVLRQLWSPTGLQWLADILLHDAIPLLYLVWWLVFVPKGGLRLPDVVPWLIYPLAYLTYALIRGALSGWYPYPFIDAGALGYGRVTLNALGILLGFTILSTMIVGIDHLTARRRGAAELS